MPPGDPCPLGTSGGKAKGAVQRGRGTHRLSRWLKSSRLNSRQSWPW